MLSGVSTSSDSAVWLLLLLASGGEDARDQDKIAAGTALVDLSIFCGEG